MQGKLFALLFSLACLWPGVMMDQGSRETYPDFSTTVLLTGTNLSLSLVFNVEWSFLLNGSEESGITILTFSPSSHRKIIADGYKERVVFSETDFSLRINHFTSSDEGVYVLNIQVHEGDPQISRTRIKVISVSPWTSYGFFGYPGYLGYIVITFYIFLLIKRIWKSSKTQPECIYENTEVENTYRNRKQLNPIYISHSHHAQ